jgi:hypothetical protein
MSFVEELKNRRSIYVLGKEISLSEKEVSDLVKEVIKESPSSFNSQSQRAVLLFNEHHEKLWSITEELLKPLVPEEAFEATKQKLESFSKGKGTVLFFEDQEVVEGLQSQFPLYAENFPIWSDQASGIAQNNVWMAFAQENIGANLQHYNPIIDDAVAKEWNIPSSWNLRAQLVFGSIEAPAAEKEYISDEDRFLIFE